MESNNSSRPLHIYRASAGSGKTFLLTVEYLALVLQQPYAYREILAVTFTNKATEEMKTRILEELRNLALDKDTAYRKILLEKLPTLQSSEQLTLVAAKAYRNILHDYSRFAINTIDSFVQQVIRSFAYEIGLDAGFELQLNADLVKEDLAQRLFELIETNAELLDWMQRIALERIEEGKSWDFRQEMLDFAGEIFKERFHLFEANMRLLEDPSETFNTLRNKLYKETKEFEAEMVAIGKQALKVVAANGLNIEDFSYKEKGVMGYFLGLEEKRFAPGTRANGALDNLGGWMSKSTKEPLKGQIESVYPALNDLLNQAINRYEAEKLGYETAKAVLRELDNLNLLRLLAEQLADYRRDNNALLISDTQQLLRELVRDNDAPFIYEKMGSRFQHFLLDEFQDTSSFQWDNFRPLVEQSVATNQFNLVVGDVKQSIYRWRNGDWRLLQEQVKKDIGAAQVQEATLQENYRSNRQLIAFNNALFASAPRILQQHFNGQMNEVEDPVIHAKLEANQYFQIIEAAYADAAQKAPEQSPQGGTVSIRFFQQTQSRAQKSWREEAETWLCQHLDDLIANKGIDPARITLLTRNNNDARYLIDLLLQYQQQPEARCKYGIVSSEALLINASPAVQLLLSALRYLMNEKDSLALVSLVQANALRLNLELDRAEWYRVEQQHALSQLPEAFRTRRRYLLQTGIYESVEELISIFALDEWSSELAYILAFRDLVNNYAGKGRSDIREFLDWWAVEGEDKALPMASAVNAVQVLTIHKSKGLAFDIVIIPYADWKLVNDKGLLWCHWDQPGSNLQWVPVTIKKDLAKTSFAFDYFEEQLMSRMDALNLLYVALTRAREAIYVLAPAPTENKSANNTLTTIGDLLWQSIQANPELQEQFTEHQYWLEGEIHAPAQKAKTVQALPIQPSVSISALIKEWQEPGELDLSTALARSDQQKIGELAHLVLARIHANNQLDQVIRQLELQGWLPAHLKPEVSALAAQALEHPQLADWFNGAYTSISEKAILLKGGGVRRPDKVLAGANETILLDFKFTQEASAAHRKQLSEYQQLLQQMGYPSVKAFIYYGFSQQLVALAQLPAGQGNLFQQ